VYELVKRFKNGDFDISDKRRSGCLAAMEEDELQENEKKIVKNNRKYFD